LTFDLRQRPPPISKAMLIPTAFLTICAAFGIGSLAGPWGGLIGLAAACVLGPYLWKKHNRALSPPPVTVSTDHLTGPLTVHSALESVPLESIRSIEIRKVGAHPLLVIGAEDAAFMWPAGAFVDTNAVELLKAAVVERIAALPEGAAQLARIEAHTADAVRVLERPTTATHVITAIIVVLFGVELLAGATSSAPMLLRMGANAPALVAEGQWWRLFSVHALHGSIVHAFMNALALSSLGSVEQLLGTRRFIVVALAGGWLGFIASTVFGHYAIAVGASAIAFALMGSLLTIQLMRGRSLPAGTTMTRRSWVITLGINVAISLLPNVDMIAHAGGFAGGALLTFVLIRGDGALDRVSSPRLTLAAAITVAAFVLGFGATACHAFDGDVDFDLESVHALLGARGASSSALNNEAWRIAVDEGATREGLIAAEAAARRAVELASDPRARGSFLDTWAHLAHRLDRSDDAARLQREAASLAATGETFTTLGRYLSAIASPGSVTLSADDAMIRLTSTATTSRLAVYIRARSSDGAAVGLARVLIPAGVASVELPVPVTGAAFEALFADTSGPEPDVTAPEIVYFPVDLGMMRAP